MLTPQTSAFYEFTNRVILTFPEGYRQYLAAITITFEDEEGKIRLEEISLKHNLNARAECYESAVMMDQECLGEEARGDDPSQSFSSVPATTLSQAQAIVGRDPSYYFEYMTIQAEDTLYQIPEYQIYPVVRSLLRRKWNQQENSKDSVIVLRNVQSSDFCALLKLLYPLSPELTPDTLTSEEWISVLKIASQRDYQLSQCLNKLRSMAIDYLAQSQISLEERITLGRKYLVGSWVKPSIKQLIKNEEPISLEMVERVGIRTVAGICRIRELSYGTHPNRPRGLFFDNKPKPETKEASAMSSVFKEDLESRRPRTSFASGGDEAIDRIILAHQHNQSAWLLSALEEVVSRAEGLTAEQAEKFPSVSLALKVWQVRLDLRRPEPYREDSMAIDEAAFEKEFAFEQESHSGLKSVPSAFGLPRSRVKRHLPANGVKYSFRQGASKVRQ